MMAEEKKSIEISYKANLKDLLSKLKQMPNVTEAEAKKMVSALDRQLKQAEKAAKRSADASKKAAQASARAARNGASDFSHLADSARMAEERLDRVAESSGDIDRGFSSIGLALRGVNPQLAEAADGLADTFAVVEGLTMSFSALNPVIVGAAAVLGTLTLGYMSYQQEVQKAKELTLSMRDAQKALSDQYKTVEENLRDAQAKLADQRDQLAITTGQINEYEAALLQAEKTASASFEGNIQAQKDLIAERESDLALITRIINGDKVLSDQEKERLKSLQLITKQAQNNLDLTHKGLREEAALSQIRVSLTNEISKQEQGLEIIKGFQSDAVELALQEVEYKQANAEETERLANAEERAAKAKQKALEAEQERQRLLQQALDFSDEDIKKQLAKRELEKSIFQATATDLENQIAKVDEKYQKEFERAEELGLITGDMAQAQELVDALKIQRAEELREIQRKNAEDQATAIEATQEQLLGGYASLFSALGDATEAFSQDNKQAQLRAFQFQKSISAASIIAKTAEAIVSSLSQPPPLNAIMAATATATGAAQLAKVQSQQPPSFHMGGYAPDETNARVLKGEAVLDRGTVRRLGGESGVKQLQQGKTNNETVVIIQPFKHFGRFAKELGYRKPRQMAIGGY
jgi:hypothetical protein